MKCIYCGNETRVTDKRQSGEAVRRRRECLKCGKRFTTYERAAEVFYVIKRDGSRERFSKQKIISGMLKACEKRPVGRDDIERFADRVEAKVRRRGVVRTTTIGRWVLNFLKKKDKLAYVRFASVYKSPEDIDDFEKILKEVESDGS